ncbi:MAG: PAS domain S-box protein, partial [Proteobacteria bacterium]|nr:PAS domain S-box protein [Pseudomonadota bacterium]
PKLRELLETILPEKTSFDNYEVEHDFATIGKHTMLLNARQIEQAMGKERIILLAIEDITERMKAETILKNSEEQYRRLFETADDGILLLEKSKLKIRHANPAIKAMLGYSDKELIGNDIKNIGIPDTIGTFQEILQTLNKDGIAHFEDVVVQNKAGEAIYTDIYMADRALLVQCNVRDITGRKKAENEIIEREEKYRRLFESIRDAILVADVDRSIIDFNSAFGDLFGYSINEIRGKKTSCVYENEEQFHKLGKALKEQNGKAHFLKTVNYKKKNGEIFPGETGIYYLKNQNNEVTGLIGLIRDITAKRKSEADKQMIENQLHQAQKMESVGRLAGGVAHDYNNISSIIIGYTELALESIEQSNPLYDDLMEILTAAKRSTNITRQLLAFARQQTVAPKVIDLNDTIGNMLKMLRRLIGEDIDLAWMPGAEVWPVKIDPSQIDQVLANLCVNARDAIADVGKVTIETKNVTFDEDYCNDHAGFIPGEFVLLAVSDDGSGMAPEILGNIFEPFFTTKGPGKGTGLGLATVYGIAKQNNGFINVYSELEKGTTIKIYLLRHTGQVVQVQSENFSEIPLGRGETILLVEDDRSILKLGKRILGELGYSVMSITCPNEAIKLAEKHGSSINLLITDVVMPEMNGRELSEHLKILYPDLKVLFMSGYTANVIAHRGVLDDGVNFISKPFSKKDMAVKVREILDEAKTKI